MNHLDQAIQLITKLRIKAVKENNQELEQSLYDVEILIFKAYDDFDTPGPIVSADEMPTSALRERRLQLNLTIQAVADKLKVHKSSISRLENQKQGAVIESRLFKALHNFYRSRGV